MAHAATTTELFLVAMAIIFLLPYLAGRLARLDNVAPLVVVQIVAGVLARRREAQPAASVR